MTIGEFREKHSALPKGEKIEDVSISLNGRVARKAGSGAKLLFYDLVQDDVKIQLFCDKTFYLNQEHFELIHEFLRRGDVIGVRGFPFRFFIFFFFFFLFPALLSHTNRTSPKKKDNEGELSLVPTEITLLTPCLHLFPSEKDGLEDQETRYRMRFKFFFFFFFICILFYFFYLLSFLAFCQSKTEIDVVFIQVFGLDCESPQSETNLSNSGRHYPVCSTIL